MKKLITAAALVIMSVIIGGISALAYDTVNLPKTMTLADALGVFSADEITSATVSLPVEGKYVNLTKSQYTQLYEKYSDITLTRYITPSPFRGPALNVHTSAGMASYYSGSGVQVGMFGYTNFICYRADGSDEDDLWELADLYFDGEQYDGASVYINTDRDYYSEPSDPWAKDDVRQAADRCLVPYDFVGHYNENITREQFCILAGNFIAVAANYPTLADYAADKGIWWQNNTYADCYGTDTSIDILCSMGVVNGISDTEFNPDAPITREEAAKLLCKAAEQFRYIETQAQSSYSDYYDISEWARFYVDWVSGTGIMNGTDNVFDPHAEYTVEQALVTINRLYEFVR